MPTKTPREPENNLEEKIYELSRLIERSAEGWHTFNHDVYLPALKTLLEEARQQGREEMKKEFIKFVKEETSFPKIRLLDRKDLLNFLSL